MKQIGNLAVVCANRKDVLLQIQGKEVAVHVGSGLQRESLYILWDDDNSISDLIGELNYGKYRLLNMERGN